MSKTTDLLEVAVAVVIENTPAGEVRQTNRQRANVDKAFARILTLIAPRIRHFIRQYGLVAHWDDAEQVCAIAVHRAIAAYDPEKAKFTTFVNWQIRGELQGLRFRLMADQRPSAKKVSAATVSLDALAMGMDGEDGVHEFLIEDESALPSTEAAASSFMAEGAAQALLDAYVDHLREVGTSHLLRARAKTGTRAKTLDAGESAKLEERIQRDREIVEHHLFNADESAELPSDLTRERLRQITRRASKIISELAEDGAHLRSRPADRSRSLLPSPAQRQSQMVRVKAIASVPADFEAADAAFLPREQTLAPRGARLN
ncbi:MULTISPECIES: sigma factor [unclassified Sphingomonas]|uniref:sigma factor n=1 Tax=unclassified Sphingomonas TaxID=196159 RepID=UPI001F575594|nr:MULTISPECIES: sigma factor [unclassified Sphingomonas]